MKSPAGQEEGPENTRGQQVVHLLSPLSYSAANVAETAMAQWASRDTPDDAKHRVDHRRTPSPCETVGRHCIGWFDG